MCDDNTQPRDCVNAADGCIIFDQYGRNVEYTARIRSSQAYNAAICEGMSAICEGMSAMRYSV